MMFLAGCDREQPHAPKVPPAADGEPTRRIITLAPAVTQVVVDLGLGREIVGISENDDAAPKDLPVVGTFVEINYERLLSLKPTHVFMMTGLAGVPERLQSLASEHRFTLKTYNYPKRIADVGTIIAASDGIGANAGVNDVAQALRREIFERLGAIAAVTSEAPRRRVLLAFGTNPLMASGPGTVLDDLLSTAGGENAMADAAVGAPVIDREKLLTIAPDVILLLLPKAPPLTSPDDPRLAMFRGMPIPAVQAGRVAVINDPHTLLPSSTMPRIAALLAKAIHPELSDAIDQAYSPQSAEKPGS
jgi:iron complex transport system substrate-binding protein